MKSKKGFTLTELVMVVAVLSIMMAIAIPRMGWGMMDKVQAETTARKFSDYLKLARSLAITHASNSDGYQARVRASLVTGEMRTVIDIVRMDTEETVKTEEIPKGVTVNDYPIFHFTPLGKLNSGTTQTVQLTKSGNTAVVTVTAIGRITFQ